MIDQCDLFLYNINCAFTNTFNFKIAITKIQMYLHMAFLLSYNKCNIVN